MARTNAKAQPVCLKVTSKTGPLSFNKKDYDLNQLLEKAELSGPVHSTAELVRFLEDDKNKDVQLEGRICFTNGLTHIPVKIDRQKFLEFFKGDGQPVTADKLKESFKEDFGRATAADGSYVGSPDFVPTMGGPFNKQLYLTGMLQAKALAYYHYNHSPICKNIVHTIRDFTLGRGWRADVKCKDKTKQGVALALWRAFEDANELYEQMRYLSVDLSLDGEIMFWKLPNNAARITYKLAPSQQIPRAALPRVRLIDTSSIYEIITYPEDILRPLFYVQLTTTSYSMYSAKDQGAPVPTIKFIFQHIPADQVIHHKINVVTGEKRGRGDLFQIIPFAKRLTDVVDYKIIQEMKNCAWGIDTTVETGDQTDIDKYIESVKEAEGETGVAPAGSEFVHTAKVKRQYLANSTTSSAQSDAFRWVANMISAGSRIPYNYWGFQDAAGTTKASAETAVEPVEKFFESRQIDYEIILKKLARWLFDLYELPEAELEVTFPDIKKELRSNKFNDLTLAQTNQWFAKERCAEIAAKEMSITDYDFSSESAKINAEGDAMGGEMSDEEKNPLTAPADNSDNKPNEEIPNPMQKKEIPNPIGTTKGEIPNPLKG